MRKILSGLAVVLVLVTAAAGIRRFMAPDAGAGGLSGSSVTAGLVLLDSERGVYVLAVSDRSPADHAGLEPGDVIVKAGDIYLETSGMLEELMGAEGSLPLTVLRGERQLYLNLSSK